MVGEKLFIMRGNAYDPFAIQQIKEAYDKPSSPGQGTFWLQTCVSLGSPLHFFPPYRGAGELHSRVLDCFPCLHVFVHVLHSLHTPQLPSTGREENFYCK